MKSVNHASRDEIEFKSDLRKLRTRTALPCPNPPFNPLIISGYLSVHHDHCPLLHIRHKLAFGLRASEKSYGRNRSPAHSVEITKSIYHPQ